MLLLHVKQFLGCSEITQVEGRYLIHDGDVTELDPNDFKQIAKLRLFLLNDSILIARQNEDIKGGSQFIFKSTV